MVPATETITFQDGDVDGAVDCVTIIIIDDISFENDHSFTAQIAGFTPNTLDINFATNEAATITIQDDDSELVSVV